jgi:hypothetical protein
MTTAQKTTDLKAVEEEDSDPATDKKTVKSLTKTTITKKLKTHMMTWFAFLQKDILCLLQDKPGIPNSQTLLDSQTIMDVFSNPRLPTNIQDMKWTLTLYFNAGKAIVFNMGDLKGYGTVWFYPDGITNILSLCNR